MNGKALRDSKLEELNSKLEKLDEKLRELEVLDKQYPLFPIQRM